jgi:hypothetical protein
MSSTVVAFLVAVLVTVFLLSHWKLVLQVIVAVVLVLALLGVLALLQTPSGSCRFW